ncbi:serine threonine kinase [Physcia stellaris]|nr:serine threonine kinase [Physcia stellaris]
MGSTACMKDGFFEGSVLDGRFESLSPLNHGSFGMVFLARDLTNGEMVAIKCLTKSSNAGGCPLTLKDDITVELTCHERLGSHPNLVNLIHSFETPAHLYLVLEFCSMGDLYEAIRLGRGPLETKNVREFMLQLINAVDFMHSRGLYHRDIKPENIFLTQDGNVKLGDFGLATGDPWSYESSVGSDRYMAPEQYDCADTGYSPAKADTWAIGICLLNVLFSRNPFVTPTESDVLFADFVRDNQSLFDIFPNMSQDTFDVLVHAMAIDPAKRSLSAVRECLVKVVSFTTDEEVLDDFCAEEREVVQASANREPLRTPSISSPQVGQDAFPWAKALQKSPQKAGRQLSAIPDTESYTEDLFSGSDNRDSWYSAAQNSSLTSGLDSLFGASVKSMVLNAPAPRNVQQSKPPVSGSLPMRPSKPLPTLSSIFGKKGNSAVSKSWTDLWDEDEEEFIEHEEALKRRREYNSRTWSQESKDNDPTLGRTGLAEIKNASTVNSRTRSPGQDSLVMPEARTSFDTDGFIFEDANAPTTAPRYSPPSKRTIMDKWSALGNRRRAFHQDNEENNEKRPFTGNWRDGLGLKGWTTGRSGRFGRSGRKEIANNKVRDWRQSTHATSQHDDSEWVGGNLLL